MLKISANNNLIVRNFKRLQFPAAYFCNKAGNATENSGLGGGYQPGQIEPKISPFGYFVPDVQQNKSFSLILPPPNITGNLHLGHALTATIQDVIVRWKQMQGIETVWIPGIDHAGIATQVVVEKRLWKECNKSRHDIGREAFQEHVWKWKSEKANVIGEQLRRLGVALNWSRQLFTMDPEQSCAVTAAFIKLFDMGLIYRADHLVNWSCILQSAISDIEVEHVEIDGPTPIPIPGYDKPIEFGTLTYFAYKIVDSNEELVVATTRPETILGDVAVAVNPNDHRYREYIGRYLWHPFRQQTIPIISDDFVNPEFGTGAVKVTPAHDPVDFQIGKRHKLDNLQIIDERGNLTQNCGQFAGVRRFDARDLIVTQLDRLQLLRDKQNHKMIVPICSRSNDIIEYLVRPQWFVKCTEMARNAVDLVRNGEISIEPKHFEKTWFNWLENIRDWCVSRQLWWGHRIPIYRCYNSNQPETEIWVAAENLQNAQRKAATLLSVGDQLIVEQDEDVLDTWFSSALLPFSALGWPQQTGDFSKYYPLSLMETGHDILFFWVARMVMLGLVLTNQPPFKRILLHGIICDAQGRKMSKSLGNVIAPEDVITGSTLEELEAGSKLSYTTGILSSKELERAIHGQKKMFPQGIPECGADALRFTLCSHNIKSHFINFDVQECYTNKLFCNKIWQATKFVNFSMEKIDFTTLPTYESIIIKKLPLMDRWILSRLSNLIKISKEAFENYDFYIVTNTLKNFLYFEFCDIYLETTKRDLRMVVDSELAGGHCWTLTKSLDTAFRILAPFMPRLAQHLHQHLIRYPNMPKSVDFPQEIDCRDEQLEKDVETIMESVVAIRRLKKIFGVTAKHQPKVHIISNLSLYNNYKAVIEDLASCHEVNIVSQLDKALIKHTVSDRIGTNTTIYINVPVELRQALELDLVKLDTKKTKLIKELEKMNKMVSGTNYKLKATQQAQEMHTKKIATLLDKLERIEYLKRITKL